jgi:hypothetical protein
MTNWLKKEIETEYQGTKIILDNLYIIQTALLGLLAIMLLIDGEYYPGITLVLIAALPFAHETGHYIFARKRGFQVSEMRFTGISADCKVEGTLSHRDTRDIALGGELMTGIIFMGSFYLMLLWGQSIDSPFTVFTAIIPCVWILSWIHKDSDMLIALKAHHFMKAQERKD